MKSQEKPTLEDVKNALRTCSKYPEEYLDSWAEWLHENYHAELKHLRPIVFSGLERMLKGEKLS